MMGSDGYDSVEILRSSVRVNGDVFAYDTSLDDALAPVIKRVQNRTRTARGDLETLTQGTITTRVAWFFDEVRTSIPISRPYRESIDRADGLVEVGLMIEHNGVVSGGSLAFYAAVEKAVHEAIYKTRFGVAYTSR